ncbi:MAG: mycofactocin biosynthesis glycosyltransferase MftF [Acidimicrobiales bacterium]
MGTFARTDQSPSPLRPAPRPVLPLPVGFGLKADPDLRVAPDGRVLFGGSPMRVLRLRPRAAEMVEGWLGGALVEDQRSDRRVARKLVAAGALHPVPPDVPPGVLATVVVPVRERSQQLARVLGSLGGVPAVVADDASTPGAEIEKVAREAGAGYVRLEAHSGPAAARNAGLATVRSPLVAFIDSDCVAPTGWLDRLIGHFADPQVALVAPRIRASAGQSWLGRYETAMSPLDLGPNPGRIAPRTRIGYVPAAAIVVRRAAFGGRAFDERLSAGEDIDLVWRLVGAGWEARYVPEVEVAHESEVRPLQWAMRRVIYGSSAGPLGLAHGDAVAPARLSPVTAASVALLASGRPLAAIGASATGTAVLAGRLAGVVDDPLEAAARLAAVGTIRSSVSAVAGMARAWSPALVLSLCIRRLGRLRAVAAVALAVRALDGWERRPRDLDPTRYLAARAADDLSYAAGLWWGAARSRTPRPLLPAIAALKRPARRAADPTD